MMGKVFVFPRVAKLLFIQYSSNLSILGSNKNHKTLLIHKKGGVCAEGKLSQSVKMISIEDNADFKGLVERITEMDKEIREISTSFNISSVKIY